MAKRFFVLFALFVFSSGVSFGQDVSLINRAFPNNHPPTPASLNPRAVFSCSDEWNTFEYDFQSLIPAGQANLELDNISFSLPLGYTYLPGSISIRNASGTTTLASASVTVQPDIFTGGVLLNASLGQYVLSPGLDVSILFQAKLDCRTFDGQQASNFIPLTLHYFKSNVASQFVLDNSENNANSFDINFAIMQPSYTNSPAGDLVAFREYTRQLNIINAGLGETKKFKIAYNAENALYNGFFKISSLTAAGASIIPGTLANEYEVTLASPLLPGQQLTITEVFFVDGCPSGNLMQIKTLTNFACASDCDAPTYTSSVVTDLRPTANRPELRMDLMSSVSYTDAPQTVNVRVRNNISSTSAIGRNVKLFLSKSITLNSVDLLASNQSTVLGSVAFIDDPGSAYYELDFSAISAPASPFTNEDADPAGILNDLTPSKSFFLKLNFSVNCAENPSISYQITGETSCRNAYFFSNSLAYITPQNTSLSISGATDFEYNIPAGITFSGTKPSLSSFMYNTGNVNLSAEITLPSDLSLDFAALAADNSISLDGTPAVTVSGTNKIYTVKFSGAYPSIPSLIRFSVEATNLNSCILYREEEISFSFLITSSVSSVCRASTNTKTDLIFLLGDEVPCVTGGGTVVYGTGGGGTPSVEDLKLRTTQLEVRRTTWGYSSVNELGDPRHYYSAGALPGNEIDEAYISATPINLQAAIENDEVQLTVRGKVIGGTFSGQDIKLRFRYNYNQATMLPFSLMPGAQCELRSSGDALKGTVGLDPGAGAVVSGVIPGTGDNYIDLVLNFSGLTGGVADGDLLIATLKIKVQKDFIVNAGEYLNRIFRANFFIDNAAATISRGNRLALYQYRAQPGINGNISKQFCSSSSLYTGSISGLANITANPFFNEFRPLVRIDKLNPSSPQSSYTVSFYSLLGNSVFIGVSASNPNIYLPWGISSFRYTANLGDPACATSSAVVSTAAQYTTIPDGQFYSSSGSTSRSTATPNTTINKFNSQVTHQAYGSTASWKVYIQANNTAGHYVKFIPSTSGIRLQSYSINGGALIPYTASVQGEPIPLFSGSNEITFYAAFDRCAEGGTDHITLRANHGCSGSGCSAQSDDLFTLNLDYKSAILGLQNTPQQDVVVTGLCAGFTFTPNLASLGVADLSKINFGLHVPGTLTLATADAKLTFQGTDYALPATTLDPFIIIDYKNKYLPDNFKIWEMKDIVNGGILQGTHGGPSGQSAQLTFRVDAVCAQGGDFYDPEQPIQLVVHAQQNCGRWSRIHNTFKVIPSGYVKPTSKVRLTLATTGFRDCNKRTRVRLTYSNLTFGSADIPDDYIVELIYDHTIVSYVAGTTSPDPAVVIDGENPNLRKLQWFVSDVTQATSFEPNFTLNSGVNVQAVEFRAKVRKKVVINYCPEQPVEACNKVYASLGRELLVRSKVLLPECDLIGNFSICALQEGETFTYSTTLVSGGSYTWSVPSPYATITQDDGHSISVTYSGLIGSPASIGDVSVTISAPSLIPSATYTGTVHVQQPIVNYSPLVLDTECPELGVPVNTSVRVNVTNAQLNTPYSLDINEDGIADFTTFQGYFMVTFPAAGTYPLKLVGSSPEFCSESDGTLNVVVQDISATVTAPYICVVRNETSTIDINGPAGAPASSYTWYQNGLPLNGAGGTSYTTNQPGTYTIVLNDLTCASPSEIDALMASNYGTGSAQQLQSFAAPEEDQNESASEEELLLSSLDFEEEYADGMNSDVSMLTEDFSAPEAAAAASLLNSAAENVSYVIRYANGVYWIEVIVRERLCFFECDPCVEDCPCDSAVPQDCVPCRNNPNEMCKSTDKNQDGLANDCCLPLNEIQDGLFSRCCDPTIENCGPPPPPPCEDRCNGCLELVAGKYYILTAWIHESVEQTSPLKGQGAVEINFEDDNDAVIQSYLAVQKASSPLIDGWKRVFIRFLVPMNYKDITVVLKASPDYDVRYDDIRFHPEDGTMQSFVFDPRYLRLTAVLDENNYATFYDYDNEGKLTRVKKETERGIMTIRESRENMSVR